MARLKVKYTEEIAPALMKKFQYKSVMQIPNLSKVIVNCFGSPTINGSKKTDISSLPQRWWTVEGVYMDDSKVD